MTLHEHEQAIVQLARLWLKARTRPEIARLEGALRAAVLAYEAALERGDR